MKILCISPNGLHNDGITNSIINYYRNMDFTDIEIHILMTKKTDPLILKKFEESNLPIVFTDFRSHTFSYLLKTANLIRKEKYDIVHVHGSSALLSLDLLAAKLGGCRIRIAHSRNTTCNHKTLDKFLRPFFYKLCNVRFACGTEAGKWLFGNRPFTVIKNGKNLDEFSFNSELRVNVRKEKNWDGKIVLGHVGTFNYQKNHKFLIDVFAELQKTLPNSILVLVGSESKNFEAAKTQVRDLGLAEKVIFTGSVNNVAELLQGMDIMLFPSHYEGFPNVVLEWQAVGLPCLISDKITKECAVTDLVTFLPIDQGTKVWCDAVQNMPVRDREKDAENARKSLEDAGFDIVKDAENLRYIYFQLVEDYS